MRVKMHAGLTTIDGLRKAIDLLTQRENIMRLRDLNKRHFVIRPEGDSVAAASHLGGGNEYGVNIPETLREIGLDHALKDESVAQALKKIDEQLNRLGFEMEKDDGKAETSVH